MDPPLEVRLDKWLWAARLYRTRSQATEACRAGHVKVGGQNVKPSHTVRVGEVISAQTGHITRTVKVTGLLALRLGAKAVPQYFEDLTPAAEYEKRHEPNLQPLLVRPKGTGRPTKRDRRLLDALKP